MKLYRGAGLISIHHNDWAIHFGVRPRYWVWGSGEDTMLVFSYLIGCGPLFLFAKMG